MIAAKGVIIPNANSSAPQNTLYFNSIEDFPLVGQANTLYVDKTTKFIYLWKDGVYETADFNIPSPPQPPEPTTLFFDSKEDFPGTGETDKVYISKDNGISWTWNATHEKYIDSEGRIGYFKGYITNWGNPTVVVFLSTIGLVTCQKFSTGTYAINNPLFIEGLDYIINKGFQFQLKEFFFDNDNEVFIYLSPLSAFEGDIQLDLKDINLSYIDPSSSTLRGFIEIEVYP
jgi:hypothetical protein